MGELLAFLKTNAFASGGLILLLVGGLAASLRSVPGRIWRVIRQHLILQVQVTSDDPAYEWLEEWVAKQPASRKTKTLRVVTRHIDDPEQRGKTQPRALLVPGPGEHALRYAGSYLWLTIDRERLQMASNSTGFFVNTITLRIFRGNRDKLTQLVEEARVQYENRLAGFTQIHANDPHGDWMLVAAKQVRRPESLILQGDLFGHLQTGHPTVAGSEAMVRRHGDPAPAWVPPVRGTGKREEQPGGDARRRARQGRRRALAK